MSRTLTPAKKKEIAARQDFRCANKPGSNLIGIGDYECPRWKESESSNCGEFDITGYDIDHIIPHCITHDDDPDNLQALCSMCHKMKTKMTPKKYWVGSSKNLDNDIENDIEDSDQSDDCYSTENSEEEDYEESDSQDDVNNTVKVSKIFKCNKCKNNFAGKRELQRHLDRAFDCVTGKKTSKKINKFKCPNCSAAYTRKDSLKRHSKVCKDIANNSANINGDINITNNNGDTNITNNNGNTNINNYITVQNDTSIINFCQDSDVNITDISKILKSGTNMLQKFIIISNFNPSKPKYHNIYYSDLKSGYGKIFLDGKWINKPIDEILNTLIDTKFDILRKYLLRLKNIAKDEHCEKIDKFLDMQSKILLSASRRRKFKMHMKCVLVDNKDIVLSTRNKMNHK